MSRRALLAMVTITVVTAAVLPAQPSAAAPSWADVLAARGDEQAAQTNATELTALITALETQAAAVTAAAAARGQELQRAQDAADEAAGRFDALTEQADQARSDAAGAEQKIASWSAYLARSAWPGSLRNHHR